MQKVYKIQLVSSSVSQKLIANFPQGISIIYQINDNVYAGITLRDYSIHADFVEWIVEYLINTPKK